MPKTERFPRKIDILRYNEGIQANEVLSTITLLGNTRHLKKVTEQESSV